MGALFIGYVLGRIHPPLDHAPFPFIVSASILILDLLLRYYLIRPSLDSHESWLTTNRGGSLTLMPAWAFGIAAPVAIWLLFHRTT